MSTPRVQFGFLPAGYMEHMLLLGIFGVIAAIVLLDRKVGYVYLVTRREGKKVAWRLWAGTNLQAAELGALIRSLLKQPATTRKPPVSSASRARVPVFPRRARWELSLSDRFPAHCGRRYST